MFHVDTTADAIAALEDIEGIRQVFRSSDVPDLLATDGSSPIDGLQESIAGVLLIDRNGAFHLFVILRNQRAIRCAAVVSEATTESRTPLGRLLADKSIGIVGLGSAGSKLAVSLVRMGVRKFRLIDHDVLLPENLARHALTWEGVGQHKVEATKTTLRSISSDVDVNVSAIHLTGQESNAAVASQLERLSQCDVLVDATANPRVFNLVASVARSAQQSMVWLEVFGGGIGGLVARSRPGLDPDPQDARRAFLRFCLDNPVPDFMKSTVGYEIETPEGDVLIASDADVGVIVDHAARLVLDCVVPDDQVKHHHSMYLIGLARGWVFAQPFETFPISAAIRSDNDAGASNNADAELENLEFLRKLIEAARR